MDGPAGLVFTWDPRTRDWVKERGPSDAMSPVFAPLDEGAVQTYFLDTQNGRWTSTILGVQGRQIGFELGSLYRLPATTGLAIPSRPPRTITRAAPRAEAADDAAVRRSQGRRPLAAGVALLLLIAGVAVVASETLFAPAEQASAAPSQLRRDASVEPGPVAPSPTPPSADGTSPAAEPAATQAPSAPRVTTQQLSATLPDGTQIYASAPYAVPQNSSFRVAVSVVFPGGRPGTGSVLLYFGAPGAPVASAQGQLNVSGNTSVLLSSYVATGDQPLRVVYGGPGAYALGTISVR